MTWTPTFEPYASMPVNQPPPENERVLVVKELKSGNRVVDFGRYTKAYGWTANSGCQNILYWAPCPAPPKATEKHDDTTDPDTEKLKRELKDCVNELCLECGKYKNEHLGACDECRWKVMRDG